MCVCDCDSVCVGWPTLRLLSATLELWPTQERSSLNGVATTGLEYVRTAAPVSAIPGSVYEEVFDLYDDLVRDYMVLVSQQKRCAC